MDLFLLVRINLLLIAKFFNFECFYALYAPMANICVEFA